MKELFPKNLPVEILHKIFQLEPPKQSCNFALVCKAWLKPAQAILYSKISIHTFAQLKQFYETVQQSHLGHHVKNFQLKIILAPMLIEERDKTTISMFNLMSTLLSLYLPNLEEFYEDCLHSYIPVVNALLDTQLKSLKRLNPPASDISKIEIANYVTCVMLMKERIENVLISDNYFSMDGDITGKLYFDRLFDSLDQFEKLKELHIRTSTNDEIEVMEYITEICKSLKSMSCDFRFPHPETNLSGTNDDVSIYPPLNYTPKFSMKSLTCHVDFCSDYKVLLYIMHKFPQLQDFYLTFSGRISVSLDHLILTQLLNYVSNINEYSVLGLKVDQDTITHIIGDFWETASNPKGEHLKIIHSDRTSQRRQPMLFLSKSKSSRRASTTLTYSKSTRHDSGYIEFIEENGEFIGKLHFSFLTDISPRSSSCEIPEGFMDHVFTHCPNLRHLLLEQCVLKRSTYTGIDLSQRLSMDELYIRQCILYPGMLEQYSLLLPQLKRLRLYDVFYRTSEDQFLEYNDQPMNPDIEIILPYTKINTIIITDTSSRRAIYVKVFVVADGRYYYYRANTKRNWQVRKSNEKEYNALNDDKHFYICCQTKPSVHVKLSQS